MIRSLPDPGWFVFDENGDRCLVIENTPEETVEDSTVDIVPTGDLPFTVSKPAEAAEVIEFSGDRFDEIRKQVKVGNLRGRA